MLNHFEILQQLIRCKSVTPIDGGALISLGTILAQLGFTYEIVEFFEPGHEPVQNLYARLGASGKNLCFAGHTDVVPAGDVAAWTHAPFAAEIENGAVYGRGAVDMKGAIAAFITAVARSLAAGETFSKRSISLLITGDEEGIAINGTKKMLQWLRDKGERLDACIIGEPTSIKNVGDTVKIGARGSITFDVTVRGKQGHVAYHEIAENPIPTLARLISAIKLYPFDNGNAYFQPSNVEFTNLIVGNDAENVIPAAASARFNIRFSNEHTVESLATIVRSICHEHAVDFDLRWHSSGSAFVTQHDVLMPIITQAVHDITRLKPQFNTVGGTSDARFITNICQVVELGLLNKTAHKVDENVSIDDLEKLTQVYSRVIELF
jgi:succinyl-diaminopimelate desuccinylase